MKTISFFSNKGGIGTTPLVYHLAWMLHELGVSVVAADLDPQSNLTAAFLDEERLEELWPEEDRASTIFGCLKPLNDHLGDLLDPHVERIEERLGLIPGDLGLSLFEDRLAEAWPACLEDNEAKAHDAFRVVTAFYRAMRRAAEAQAADVVLIDVGPNIGAINRAALVASDHVVVPLGADLFSLQGLRNLGPTLRTWRKGWQARREKRVPAGLMMPAGDMAPIGYIILQHAMRQDRPVKAYQRWVARIPGVYAAEVLGSAGTDVPPGEHRHMLATLKHYRSLMPLAHDAHKPIFFLKPADGAIGGHSQAVLDCYRDFENLARAIGAACGLALPKPATSGTLFE